MITNKNPQISIDCVIFGFDFEKLNVLLLDRCLKDENGNVIFCDRSLVGHHVNKLESMEDAANRILFETTGLKNIYLEQFHTFSDPKRLEGERNRIWQESNKFDPDQRVLTTAFFSLIDVNQIQITQKQRNAEFYDISNVGQLAFDHNKILNCGIAALREKMKSVSPIAFELLPTKFTLSQLQKLYEVVLDIEIDKRNFRKKAQQASYIVGLNEKQKDFSNKPAQLYMFSREIYDATKKENTNISF